MSWARHWVELYNQVNIGGKLRDTRAGLTREIIGFNRPFLHPHFQVVAGRGGSAEFALIEQLSYISGRDSEVLASNFPGFRRYQEEDGRWHGAYGPRLRIQLVNVVDELSRRPGSRRGVALIYRPYDSLDASIGDVKDIPCTLALNFWRDKGLLNCHAFMRSTDVWKGLYYDVPAFYALQQVVAQVLKDDPGTLWFTTTSLHLYQEHWDRSLSWEEAGPELRLPSAVLAPSIVAPEGALERLAMMVEAANNNLQTFYKLGVPLG